MELGQGNFKDYIKERTETNRFDAETIRYSWIEMLKCVQAIHKARMFL